MSTFPKGLIAAVVAVRTGRLKPAKVADLIKQQADDDKLFLAVVAESNKLADSDDIDDPFGGGTVAIAPLEVDAVIKGLKDGQTDVSKFGFDQPAKNSLLRLQAIDDDQPTAIMDTLLALAPSATEVAEDKPISSQDMTAKVRSVTTIRPSTRSLERLSNPDRYKIRKEHARGGMGRILIARDNVVGREVALKELLKDDQGGASVPPASVESSGITERFLREAKVTGQLEHPNIVTVYEIGKHEDGSIYYTMKFVHGVTLSKRIREIEDDSSLSDTEKLAARVRLLDTFADICNAIAYAHSKGVIHRDLKPDNIMLGEFGETVVLDWGLARVKGQEDDAAKDLVAKSRAISDSLLNSDSANLTLDGSVVGTPAYMAPEQARGRLDEIDEKTDVYALGAVLYQLLSGRPPYEGPSAGLIVQQVLAGPPLRLKSIAPNIPPELINLVERAMAQDKSRRFSSARELASEVQAYRDGRALASYTYSAGENLKRWVNRHRAAVFTAALLMSIIIAGSVFAFMELSKEKKAAEEGQAAAVAAQTDAETASELARRESLAASTAKARAETEAKKAAASAKEASAAERTAHVESEKSKALLVKLRQALAEDYAVRVQVAQGRGDYNAAYAYAAACLKTMDHPIARGAVMSDGQVIPRVWQFEPDELAVQDIYEFYSLAVSPDSKFVATGDTEGILTIWNLRSGTIHQKLKLQGTQLFSVAFHPVEPVIVAATTRSKLATFRQNPDTEKFELANEPVSISGARVTSLEFSPDGQVLALGGEKLFLLNWPEMTTKASPKTGDYWPMIARFSPDGTKMATTSLMPSLAFGDATIWQLGTGKTERQTIPSNRWELFSSWSPDSKYLATAGFGGEITVRRADKMGSKGQVLIGHTSTVLQVTYSPSGRYIASASADGTVRLWSTHTGRSVAMLSGFPAWVQSVLFDPGETLLILRDINGRISVWDIRDFDRNSMRVHSDDVIDLTYNKDGTLLATASIDGRISLISPKKHKVVQTLGAGTEPYISVEFLPGQNRVLAGNMRGLRVFKYGGTATNIATHEAIIRPGAAVLDISAAPDGKHFIFVHYQSFHVCDALTLKEIREIELDDFAMCCSYSPDSNQVAIGTRGGGLVLCDPSTGVLRSFEVAGKSIFALVYSPDGKYLALASESGTTHVFDLASEKVVKVLQHPGAVFGVDFSADSKLLFTSSQDRLVRVFDTANWRQLAILSGPESVATRVAANPNGLEVVAGSQDDTVRFWSLRNLFAKRDSLQLIAEGKTGLAVDEKSLVVTQLESWPMNKGKVSGVVKTVRARALLDMKAASRRWRDRYEGFYYSEKDGIRNYLPYRKRDAFGKLIGEPKGQIDHVSWWMGQLESTPPSWFWRKAFLTEITVGSQADKLGLKSGDVIWTVNGKWVSSKETLIEALKSKEGKSEIVLRRFARDQQGRLIPMLNEAGAYVLNSAGDLQWKCKEAVAVFDSGKLGFKANYDLFLKRPFYNLSR